VSARAVGISVGRAARPSPRATVHTAGQAPPGPWAAASPPLPRSYAAAGGKAKRARPVNSHVYSSREEPVGVRLSRSSSRTMAGGEIALNGRSRTAPLGAGISNTDLRCLHGGRAAQPWSSSCRACGLGWADSARRARLVPRCHSRKTIRRIRVHRPVARRTRARARLALVFACLCHGLRPPQRRVGWHRRTRARGLT